jgi:hypothetical protein
VGSTALACAAVLVASSAEAADAPPAPTYVPSLEAPKPPDGPSYALDLGATFAFDHNKNVIGQPDGALVTFGYKLSIAAGYVLGPNEWRMTLDNAETLSKTPNVPELVKTRDTLVFDGIYLRHVLPWFGPFVRVSAETAFFRGADARPGDTTYVIARPDGTSDTVVTNRLRLTDPFLPSTFKQSVGPFADPVRSDPVSFEVRAGAGAREVLAKDQLAISDDSATPEVEVTQLESFAQVGAEVVATVWGTLKERGLTYKITGEAMMPLVHTDLPASDDRGALALTNLSLDAQLSLKLVSVLSLDYQLRIIREPQLLDAVQVRNNLLVSLALGSVSSAKK